MLYDSRKKLENTGKYNEKDAKESGRYIAEGHTIMSYLFEA
jgi:2,3-bisphosphoglycerate-independent phosphoglycerate mutase